MNDRAAFRRARVLSTLGPASRDPDILRELVAAGCDGVRVNFSHSSHEDAARSVRLAREVAREAGRPVAVLADLQGPKIRVGELDAPLEIEPGRRYLVVPEDGRGEEDDEGGPGSAARDPGADVAARIPTTWPDLAADLSAGDRVLFDDGRIALRVIETRGRAVVLEALDEGTLHSGKGINLPEVDVAAPSLTAKDREDARHALDLEVDYVALSFVRRPRDVQELKDLVDGRALVVAKIEKRQALRDLPGILDVADGVMVARGDLGVELDFEEVPIVQKRILGHTRESTRLGITATQMLESMIHANRPTRAEASDVANALLDGTDVVMLSAETAVGDYPVDAVRTMCRIIRRIERETADDARALATPGARGASSVHHTVAGAIAGAAAEATERLGAPFLVTFTRSGFTAWVISAQRLQVPVLAVTDQPRTWNQLALAWGVVPLLLEGEPDYDVMKDFAARFALERGLGRPGDVYVITAGVPFHVPGTTNYLRVETL
ncbi:MAG: pyruvate kinase [Gemmatimonadota bacterium]|nr:pyruvate kinase [Gemmatimonadota bacterium]